MSLIAHVREFGLRSALAKVQAAIALRVVGRKALTEPPVDAASVKDLVRADTSHMSAEYRTYVDEQIERSVRRSAYVNPLRALLGSRDRLIQQTARVSSMWGVPKDDVLSIGCRDERELDSITRLLGAGRVTGVDLFSASPRVRVADMHDLPFEAASFDMAFAIHCMEHAYDPRKSLSEMVRVTRPGGLLAIEVPVGFEVTEFDRNDFSDLLQVLSLFPTGSVSAVWCEVENREKAGKPPTLRLIVRKRPA